MLYMDNNNKSLPNDLQVLKIKNVNVPLTKNTFPNNLKKFIFYTMNLRRNDKINISNIPLGIKYFEMFSNYQCLDYTNLFEYNNLIIFRIDSVNYWKITKLPNSLKYLEIFDVSYSEEIDNKIINNNIEYLVLNSNILRPNDWNINEDLMIIYKKEAIQEYNNNIENLKYLSLDGLSCQKFLLNNLPMNLEVIRFTNLQIEINNLPVCLKKIIVDSEEKINLIKIPFGCEITTETDDIYINEYLIKTDSYITKFSTRNKKYI